MSQNSSDNTAACEVASYMKPKVMLVGPWGGSPGGVRTFMTNVADSALASSYQILRFNTARPPKRNVTNNYGYGSILQGGVARALAGTFITIFHMILFPFVLMLRRPNVVQVQSSDFQTYWESAFYVLICRLLGFPVLMRLGGAFDHFHSVSSPRARSLIQRILQWPDQLIVQSGYWRDLVRKLGRSEGVVVLPNCISEKDILGTDPANRATPVCLFAAGSEANRKGVDEVLAAIHLLKTARANVKFHIVAASESLRAAIIDRGLSDIALTEGYLSRDRMLETMRNADIFLLPTRAEGFPNALLEAMASETAAIVTPVGSIPEIVEGGCAIIIPPRDSFALAEAITQLAGERALRQRIARKALDRVRACYTQGSTLPVLESAWNALLRAKKKTSDFDSRMS